MTTPKYLLFASILTLAAFGVAHPAFASEVPPGYTLSDSFDEYDVGAYLDTATSTPWVTLSGDGLGHFIVTNSGCVSGNCIYGSESGASTPGAYMYNGDADGAFSGSISFSVKFVGVPQTTYLSYVNAAYFAGDEGYPDVGYGIYMGNDGSGNLYFGNSDFQYDNLATGVWHTVVLSWTASPGSGTTVSASVDGSISQQIYHNTSNDLFAQHGANSIEVVGTNYNTTTYYDNINTQLLDIAAATTPDYGLLATSTCTISNVTGCFQNALSWAFLPPVGAFNGITALWGTLDQKPPFGYFTVGVDEVEGVNASSTPAFSLGEVTGITTYIFHPIDLALAAIWWGIFGIWFFFHRLRHIEI